MADLNASREIREILAVADAPLTISEIYNRSESATNTTVVAALMYAEIKAGRVTRTGSSGRYAYSLNPAGRKALNPKSAKGIEESAALDAGRSTAVKSIKDLLGKAAPASTPPAEAQPDQAPTPTPPPTPAPGHAPPAARENNRAPKHSPTSPPPPKPGTEACRLAAAVVCFWPAPLATIPADLADLVRAHLATWLPER